MGDNLPAIEVPEGWILHSLAAGYYHTCALVDQVDEVAGVVCWGTNLKGQVKICGRLACCRLRFSVIIFSRGLFIFW